MSNIRQCTVLKNRGQEETKHRKERTKTSGAPDISIQTRTEGATVQLCGDSDVAEKKKKKGSMVFMLLRGSQSVKIAVLLKACTAKAAEVVGVSVPTESRPAAGENHQFGSRQPMYRRNHKV